MKTENKKPSNPSVYPDPMRGAEQSYSNQSPWQLESGMTLRDEIAMRAMQGHLSTEYAILHTSDKHNDAMLCIRFYEIADAMLKQREL